MKTHACLLAFMLTAPVLLVVLAGESQTPAAQAQPVVAAATAVPQRSLYDRLGGVYPIAVVVDDFIERLLVDDTLNANSSIRDARERVPRQGLKFHVTALVCQATGGPCTYTGRDMKTAHAHLNISEKEWQAMLDAFHNTLDKFKVPAAEQDELVAIVNTTKPEIVAGSSPDGKPQAERLQ
jgi:hemoglobin